ncbi:MAG: glycerate kinase [Phycisphaerales bacterium]
MKVIIAPDSFKGSITAVHAANALARGIKAAAPSADVGQLPIGDGGEGTLDAIAMAMPTLQMRSARVTGPCATPVEARWGWLAHHENRPTAIAIVELAQAAGFMHVPDDRRNPMQTTTYGVGELIMHASAAGAEEIIVTVGGSATVDGGSGALQAMRWQFLDSQAAIMPVPMTGGNLHSVASIEQLRSQHQLPKLRVACDVRNPLCGPRGAARVYGPQKGATPEQVEALEQALAHFASLAPDATLAQQPGTGAAGGTPFGLAAFAGATLERGIDLVLELIGFTHAIEDADLIITGEGRLDMQTLEGKAMLGVAAYAERAGVPVIAIVGAAEADAVRAFPHAIAEIVVLKDRFGLERSMQETDACLCDAARDVAERVLS